MLKYLLLLVCLADVFCEDIEPFRIVDLPEGAVQGDKYWNGDIYEFFGVPYATAPMGRDKFKRARGICDEKHLTAELRHVEQVLRNNKLEVVDRRHRNRAKPATVERQPAILPYMKGVTDKIGRILKPPLPVTKRNSTLSASKQSIMCHQTFYTGEDEEEIYLNGQEDCLITNILVPHIANETNLVPVVVYIHSGAYAGGSANMGRLHYLARLGVVAINFNYRVGALGFACLGTEEIPGNAGLKDQLAAFKWIKKNIAKFGGDPNKITLAGYSVGAAMAELHAISKHSDGLFDKLILDSGSVLAPFSVNRHPITSAKNIALSLGYNKTTVEDLNEFYLIASDLDLAKKSLNFFLPNGTFGFAPCIESTENNPKPFLTESPLEILKRGDFKKLPILSGFTNMEGLSRSGQFGEWTEKMNKNFAEFLPADLIFKDNKSKAEVAKHIKEFYFKDSEITHDNKREYVEYFSDTMFRYSILKSLSLYSALTDRPIYFYEFSYFGELSTKHHFMDRMTGATHRDQVSYLWDFFGYTNIHLDMDVRDRMTYMWTDFVKFENPTPYESALTRTKWLKYTDNDRNYISISNDLAMKKDPFPKSYQFWDEIYKKYYWSPTSEKIVSTTKK